MTNPYPAEVLDEEYEDCGVMPENVETLGDHVIGHKIVSAEKLPAPKRGYGYHSDTDLVLTLDNGDRVRIVDTDDCCAYTELKSFLFHPEKVDHVITGVGTTEGYTKWHIYADFGDVLELSVGWSCGNPFYYAYGFDILVEGAE